MSVKSVVFGAVVAFALIAGLAAAYASQTDVTAQVTVTSACIVRLSASSINFGSMIPGQNSTSDSTVTAYNDGNAASDIYANGTQWSDGGSNTMTVGRTRYSSTASQAYGSMTALTGTAAAIVSSLGGGSSAATYWKLGVPVAQAAASYNQTITFSMSC